MNDSPICSIRMLKASEGDSFFLRFQFDDKVFNLLIDTGPVSCWKDSLKEILDYLQETGEHINILIITHIDSDHIGGALKLFSCPPYKTMVDEIWFNGLKQIASNAQKIAGEKEQNAINKLISLHWRSYEEPDGLISAKQAESLSETLENNQVPQNTFVAGGAITNLSGTYEISSDFFIDILLPTQNGLDKLRSKFRIAMDQVSIGASIVVTEESERAFEYLMLEENGEHDRIEPISENELTQLHIERWAGVSPEKDSSITNASSIAVCIRFYEKKLLFLGDATAEDVSDSLQAWSDIYGENLYFDVIKLPHHGSQKNCVKLLDKIDGQYFFISTDGKKFNHPDKESLAKIVVRPAILTRYLVFNYNNKMYRLFSNKQAEINYNYRAKLLGEPLEI